MMTFLSKVYFKFWGIYYIATNYFISIFIVIDLDLVENYHEHRFHHSIVTRNNTNFINVNWSRST